MRVDSIMTSDVVSCPSGATVLEAADVMRAFDRGAIPVVDDDRHLVGIVTDRDLVVRLAAADGPRWDAPVSACMTPDPSRCRPGDSVHEALATMRRTRAGRLPVVDDHGRLVGMLSINDVVLGAQNVRAGQDRVSYEQVMETLSLLCAAHGTGRSTAATRDGSAG